MPIRSIVLSRIWHANTIPYKLIHCLEYTLYCISLYIILSLYTILMYNLIRFVGVGLDLIKFWWIRWRDTFPIHSCIQPCTSTLTLLPFISAIAISSRSLPLLHLPSSSHHCSDSSYNISLVPRRYCLFLPPSILPWSSLFISISQIYNTLFFCFYKAWNYSLLLNQNLSHPHILKR